MLPKFEPLGAKVEIEKPVSDPAAPDPTALVYPLFMPHDFTHLIVPQGSTLMRFAETVHPVPQNSQMMAAVMVSVYNEWSRR